GRPQVYTYQKDHVSIILADMTYTQLIKLANNSKFLVYTFLMAALKICIFKYRKDTTSVIGSPSVNPGRKNALAIIDHIDDKETFKEFLLRVRKTLSEAYQNQNYPFKYLINDLHLEDVKGRFPLFNILIALNDFHCNLEGINNDITIIADMKEEEIFLEIAFNTEIFLKKSIENFANVLHSVINRVMENINVRICDLQILEEKDKIEILEGFNDTLSEYKKDKCIQDLFISCVERAPDTIAVVFKGHHLTYQQLNFLANSLAHYLQTLGVEPEVRVGICLERSLEMIVGILGILKAGGVYVPIDTAYPRDRQAFMIKDSQISVLLTLHCFAEKLSLSDGYIVCLDTEWKDITLINRENPITTTVAQNLAYIIYTSGSTGKPKGVLAEHGGVCNLIGALEQILDVQQGSHVSQFASFSFDGSIQEVFVALLTGATLYVATSDILLLPSTTLPQRLSSWAITHAAFLPSVLEHLSPEGLLDLRAVMSVGEVCSANIITHWKKYHLLNGYGPTEATVI